MAKKAKTVLSLKSSEALDYFMSTRQFHAFELPEYFDFTQVLDFVRKAIGNKPYGECVVESASGMQDVNFDIMLNKDGHYAVRPLTLSNPYLYYFIAREICQAKNWKAIKECFKYYNVPTITSCAIPVIPEEVESFHESTTVFNWWNEVEQKSIELSMEYRYMFVTDITNCYGTINPETIDWALSMKDTPYVTDKNHEMARNLITYLRDIQQGRNMGIPQGSNLYNMIAEIILGYCDLLLYQKLEGIKEDYKIIRYRDDYRIYCNDRDALEQISYTLQRVLESLNFRMNSSKTKISDSIITDSIKRDKLWYIENTPIFNKKGVDFDSVEKHLLYILLFGRKFPNGGQIRTLLSDLDGRIEKHLKSLEWEDVVLEILDDPMPGHEKEFMEEKKKQIHNNYIPGGSIKAMCAIAAQIALENVDACHYALKVASRLIDSLNDEKLKQDIRNKFFARMIGRPNSTYTELWLQNMTYQADKHAHKCPYSARLCKVVMGDKHDLWNNSWLKPELTQDFDQSSIVNQETLVKVTPIITFRERRQYEMLHFD